MINGINELIEKWEDVRDTCEPDDFTTKNNAVEILEDLRWIKKLSQ